MPPYTTTATYDELIGTNYINIPTMINTTTVSSSPLKISNVVPPYSNDVEKLEKHIDELEEDIEYFNEKLKDLDEQLSIAMSRISVLEARSSRGAL